MRAPAPPCPGVQASGRLGRDALPPRRRRPRRARRGRARFRPGAHVPTTGLAATFSYGGGAELGLDEDEDQDDAGVSEIEATLGYEFESSGLRPEIGLVLGLNPDTHVACAPACAGRRAPFRSVRLALDGSNARDHSMGWRWLLLGVAAGSASRASSASSPRSTAGRRSRRGGRPAARARRRDLPLLAHRGRSPDETLRRRDRPRGRVAPVLALAEDELLPPPPPPPAYDGDVPLPPPPSGTRALPQLDAQLPPAPPRGAVAPVGAFQGGAIGEAPIAPAGARPRRSTRTRRSATGATRWRAASRAGSAAGSSTPTARTRRAPLLRRAGGRPVVGGLRQGGEAQAADVHGRRDRGLPGVGRRDRGAPS